MAKFDFESLDESGAVEEEVKPVEDNQPDEEVKKEEEEEQEFEEEEEEFEEDEEVGNEEEEEKVKPTKKKEPYTAEEIQEILKADGEVDTERLSPAEQATMKAMQRAFTPKLQEAAELRREIEDMRKSLEDSKPKAEPKDIYEAYDQDPDGVIQYLDSQVDALVSANDPNNLAQIRQLDSLKFELSRREMKKFQEQYATRNKQSEIMGEILKAVPDLQTKQNDLKKFALEELGYTEEELARETNPSISGRSAVRAIDRINKAYDKAQARVTVKKKRVKRPNNVEKPSKGGFEVHEPDKLKDAKKEAMKTGNFKNFFAAMEED